MNTIAELFPKIPLGELFDLEYGASLPERERTGIGYPVFGSNGIVGRHSKFLVQGPGIVVGRKGSVGEVCWSAESFWPIDTAYFTVPKGQTDFRWLFWLLFSTDLKSLDAATGVPGLNRNDVYTLTAHRPQPEEQSRIAAVLDTVDEASDKTEAVIAKLKQVRAGLLHDLLTRGLDEHGQLRDPIAHPEQFQDSSLGRVPREWTVGFLDRTVSQPSDLTIGPFGSNLLASDYRSEGTPVVFVRDVREDGFVWNSNIYVSKDKADELRAHSTFAGDVLTTKMGLPPCIAAVYPNTMPSGVVTADVIRLRPRVDVATSFWLTAYINSPRFVACVRQITGGVTRPKVTLTDFRKQLVLLPPVEEQKHIENTVLAIARGIEEVEAESQKLLMLKSGLMTDLLTGRVRVPAHFGMRRHDAALSSRVHEPASGPLRPATAHESGDTSPHSKDTSLHAKGNTP